MQQTLAIARREVSGLFYSPVAYLVLAVFALISGLLFFADFAPGQPAVLRAQFGWIVWLLAFIAPAISMRSLSEEFRSGSIELMMTAPVTDAQMVVGKWLGSMAFFAATLLPIVVQVLVMELVAQPDYGPILTGLLGLLLVGGLYLAIGVFASSLGDSQLVAFLITVLITGMLTIGMYLLAQRSWVPGPMQTAMFYLNVDQQYADFAKGLIDIRNFVYFASGIALFLFIAAKLVESRRWR